MMKNKLIALFLLGLTANANAGAVLEVIPADPGPYFPGKVVSAEVWIHNGDAVGHDLRLVSLDVRGLRDRLFAGGEFLVSGSTTVNHVAKLTGGSWVGLGLGTKETVEALETFRFGVADALLVGGHVLSGTGTREATVNAWNGYVWPEVGRAQSTRVLSFTQWNDGAGDRLYVGGYIRHMEDVPTYNIVKWGGDAWSAMEGLNGSVRDMVVFDDGTGPALYAAGNFPNPMPPFSNTLLRNIAKLTGANWAPLGGGVIYGYREWAVNALAVFDDGTGPALYAGGDFRHVYLPETDSFMQVNNIAKWDGTAWSAVGGGTMPNVFSPVKDMVVFDDGTGPALYVGGEFASTGGVNASNIARWDGTAWSSLDSGVTGGVDTTVDALVVFDDGFGPALYAGGQFASAGGMSVSNIAKWDGASWSIVGDGFDAGVRAFTVSEADGTPNLALDSVFQFDFSTLTDGGASQLLFPSLPGPVAIYSGPSVPGTMLHLPASGSLRLGTMDVTMPSTLGTYALDVVSPYGPYRGAFISFGFGGSGDPVTNWSGETGEITGEAYSFVVVVPDSPTKPVGEDGYAKNRYLSVVPGNAGEQTALRVTLVSSSLFPGAVGSQWWVGPPVAVSENAGAVAPLQGWPNFMAAQLQCSPHYADWDTVLGSGVPLHVYGPEVVPDASYEFEAIHEASDIGHQQSFSTPLAVPTAKWGDVVVSCSTCPCGPPNGTVDISDIIAVLNKFQNSSCAPIKARCDLDPEQVNRVIDITDVTNASDAFGGVQYPFGAPIACP